jgi:hypothetical protein
MAAEKEQVPSRWRTGSRIFLYDVPWIASETSIARNAILNVGPSPRWWSCATAEHVEGGLLPVSDVIGSNVGGSGDKEGGQKIGRGVVSDAERLGWRKNSHLLTRFSRTTETYRAELRP